MNYITLLVCSLVFTSAVADPGQGMLRAGKRGKIGKKATEEQRQLRQNQMAIESHEQRQLPVAELNKKKEEEDSNKKQPEEKYANDKKTPDSKKDSDDTKHDDKKGPGDKKGPDEKKDDPKYFDDGKDDGKDDDKKESDGKGKGRRGKGNRRGKGGRGKGRRGKGQRGKGEGKGQRGKGGKGTGRSHPTSPTSPTVYNPSSPISPAYYPTYPTSPSQYYPTSPSQHYPTSSSPSTSSAPSSSSSPSASPSVAPSSSSYPSVAPSNSPTANPTASPTISPTVAPTASPTVSPTSSPTISPTFSPTSSPTESPTGAPSASPTFPPSEYPSAFPSIYPSDMPSFTALTNQAYINEFVSEETSFVEIAVAGLATKNIYVEFYDENGFVRTDTTRPRVNLAQDFVCRSAPGTSVTLCSNLSHNTSPAGLGFRSSPATFPNGIIGLFIYSSNNGGKSIDEVHQFASWTFGAGATAGQKITGAAGTLAAGRVSFDYGSGSVDPTKRSSRGLYGSGCTFDDFFDNGVLRASSQQTPSSGSTLPLTSPVTGDPLIPLANQDSAGNTIQTFTC